ncbi:putative transport protein [Vibrio maritimus]|uniref:Putative transport protein n=1 Tax=Vibrio maritimus TaxID=990268 RepID=A0A090TQG2_9VIBR|nr:putative transport protein [Vibrio maritimus]
MAFISYYKEIISSITSLYLNPMKDERALHYYERLLDLGTKQLVSKGSVAESEYHLPLSSVAEVLFTTTRHARTVLQALQTRGWLTWTPKVGRNQRSHLILHFDPKTLRQLLGRELIEQGHYESAFSMLHGDQEQFSQLLQQTSGTMVREGQLHIQLTYQRAFQSILPHKPLRNSERFLVRQIYSCLTACDHEGNVTPQLAHHWAANEDYTQWRFYLRPRLEFHSGLAITPEAVAQLFLKLKLLPEYDSELVHVKAVNFGHQTVTFELDRPDRGFDALISDLRYSIQPQKQLDGLKERVVDGSGAFRVIEHSDERLRLEANDRFFDLPALTDTVTIWQLDRTPTERIELEHSRPEGSSMTNDSPKEYEQTQTRIENGCLYLLMNANSASLSLSALQRAYLCSVLSPHLILENPELNPLSRASIPAYNILPSWTKVKRRVAERFTLPERLSIAVYDHQVILDCANGIQAQLALLGVECRINVYTLETLQYKANEGKLTEDITIASFIVDDNLPVSVFRWLCSDAVLRQGLDAPALKWLDTQLTEIREQQSPGNYIKELESVATNLLIENRLLPLFHHRQTLRWGSVLQGVRITDWSWPDFRSVWTDE